MKNLEGKWVLLKSDNLFSEIGTKPYYIYKVSGKRVYFMTACMDWDFKTNKGFYRDDLDVSDTNPATASEVFEFGYCQTNSVMVTFPSQKDCVAAAKVVEDDYDKWIGKLRESCRNAYNLVAEFGGEKVS